MSHVLSRIALYVAGAVLLSVVYLSSTANASAPSGLPATVATTSNPTVTATPGRNFATSTCATRIITTSASPIMITFSDFQGDVPTGSFGHLQAASTTVAYDSGQYGCNAVRIYSFTSQSVTLTETR
jgi:hypothetical protein